eukprot:scaffold139729_cov18-Prasinocladus_malaysianus.AAC.1
MAPCPWLWPLLLLLAGADRQFSAVERLKRRIQALTLFSASCPRQPARSPAAYLLIRHRRL